MSFATQPINVKIYPFYLPLLMAFTFLSSLSFGQELPSCRDLEYRELRLEFAQYFKIAKSAEVTRISFPIIGKTFYLSRSVQRSCLEATSTYELGRWGLFSTTYLYPFVTLESIQAIAFFSGLHNISSPLLQERITRGELKELGGLPNPEFIIAQKISAIMLSPFFVDEQLLQRLEKLNIMVVPNFDYLESHPLARLEWMLVFGHFLNSAEAAHHFVDKVKKNFLKQKRSQERNILIGHHYHGQWFVPGGEHEFVKQIQGVGGKYLFSHLNGTGSYPVHLEEIVKRTDSAQIWLPQASWNTLEEALIADGRHSFLIQRPELDIYLFKKESGGIPFYEEGYYRPDKMREDIGRILDKSNEPLHFFKKVSR